MEKFNVKSLVLAGILAAKMLAAVLLCFFTKSFQLFHILKNFLQILDIFKQTPTKLDKFKQKQTQKTTKYKQI